MYTPEKCDLQLLPDYRIDRINNIMAKKMLGIDIGNTYLRLILCVGKEPRRCASVLLPENLVKNGQIVSYFAMADFLKETLRAQRFGAREAAVSLPLETYYERRTRFPLMTDAQLKINIPYEMHDYITGEVSEYVYDYAVIGRDEEGLDLVIVAAPKKLIKDYENMIRRAGLKLVKIVPSVIGLKAIIMPAADKKELRRQEKEKQKLEAQKKKEESVRTEEEKKEQKEKKRFVRSTRIEKADTTGDEPVFQVYTENGGIQIQNVNEAPVRPASPEDDEARYSRMFDAASEDRNAQNVQNEQTAQISGDPAAQDDPPQASPADYALVELGHGEIRLHFFSNHAYEITRTLNTSLHSVVEIIAEEQNVHPRIAQMKMEKNQDGVLENNPRIQAVLDAISTEIMRVMNFYNYNNPQNSIDAIYYYGNAIYVSFLAADIQEMTSLPVKPISDLIPGGDKIEGLNNVPQAYGAVIE